MRTSVRDGSNPRRVGDRGAAAVEFALVVPVLVMLLFGIVEFGILLSQKASLSSAVREGARYGSVTYYASETLGDRECADVIAETRNQATTIDMDSSAVEVEVRRDGASGGGTELVCATSEPSGVATAAPCAVGSEPENLYVIARFQGSLAIPATPISTDVNLESTGVYRCEY